MAGWCWRQVPAVVAALLGIARAPMAQAPSRWSILMEGGIGRVSYAEEWYRLGSAATTTASWVRAGTGVRLGQALVLTASAQLLGAGSGRAVPLCVPQQVPDPGGCAQLSTAPGTMLGASLGLSYAPPRSWLRLGGSLGSLHAPDLSSSQERHTTTTDLGAEIRLLRAGRLTAWGGVRGMWLFTPLAGARSVFGPTLSLSR
jgi:hypothetical protein